MTPATPAPSVSIVLACYNSEKYLEETLRSVQAQTWTDWELIAVNDCSTDRTAEILAAYARDDPRIRPIDRRERGGRPAVTKNTGLAHARGRRIAFLDHDDLFLPAKLERSMACLDALPQAVALFHDLHFIDGAGRLAERYLPHLLRDAGDDLQPTDRPAEYLSSERFFVFQLLRYAGFHTITTLIARDRLPADFSLRFNTDYQVCDDTDLWIRLGSAGRVAYLDESLARYRIHGNNITSNGLKVRQDVVKLQAFNLAHRSTRLTADEARLLRRRLANALSDLGWAHRCGRDKAAALAAYGRALWTAPAPRRLLDLCKSVLPARS